ncbi:hypothetical protein LR48_Vigan07g275900 [Vigna angularis]|uniref:Uncharacterized protein n=1 Tax=Phaseolus angularis TaxID=3914 RepID=A0A0L9V1S4_PHAAN|nr:hypothetical protein LR48_Vigan07g275900 [Vigna angularis]
MRNCTVAKSFNLIKEKKQQDLGLGFGSVLGNSAKVRVALSQQGFSEEEKSVGSSLALQRGQRGCLESQVSAHSTWKAWLQPGTSRAGWSVAMSSRQTAHSEPMRRSFPVMEGSFWSCEGERPASETGLAGRWGSGW